jgi:DNA helicase-2/ATP-dependent DNA helicase PcrA
MIDLDNLNPQQKEAVTCINGPSLIIAGAGSGKTRVLTYKVAYLLDKGISPYEILALTFTNKAANEMKSRVLDLTDIDPKVMWMGTFHSIFARLLRMEAQHIGFSRSFSIYDESDSENLVKRAIDELNLPKDKYNPSGIAEVISKLKNKLIMPEDYEYSAVSPFEKDVTRIYETYQKMLFSSNAMDFDDLLIRPIELFQKHEDVLKKYQERFKYILVDEYQDTNAAQYQLIRMLSAKYKNLTVVGDDAQSIYRWRGADIRNVLDFQSNFPDNKLFKLECNYRSTKKILAFASEIIRHNEKQIDKKLWTDNEDGDDIMIIENFSDKDEANRIVKQIKEDIRIKKYMFRDFAVLYRTNAQSRVLEEALRNNGLPYVIVGGIRFYQRKEIKDLLSYLNMIINIQDSVSLTRAIALQEGVGKVTIDKLMTYAAENKKSLIDVINSSDGLEFIRASARTAIIRLMQLINKYKYLRDEISLMEFVRVLIDETGMLQKLRMENTEEAQERINNIQEFINAVAEYEDNNEQPTLEGFLETVALVNDIDTYEDTKNAVTLMSIHASKGLEFPVVFVTGLEDGLFPVSSAYNSQEEMEEERRLFYVASTRARKKLYITYANQRYKYGDLTYQVKSKFLKELSDEVLNKTAFTEKFTVSKYREKSEFPSIELFRNKPEQKKHPKGERIEYIDEGDDKFSDIQKGVVVYHDKFKKGTVVSTTGKGIEKKADVHFENFGVIKIMLRYAKLTVLN